jgi:hypothetical protein
VLRDYLKVMYVFDSLRILDEYRIDHVLILDTMPLGYLLQHTPGWRVIKSEKSNDGNCLTFARVPPPETTSASSAGAPQR